MNVREGKEFQQHIHVFRGVAIILIVCAHTVPSFDWTNYPVLGRLIDGIANESSIFFFFIAGYLFQHLSPRFQFSSYLLQKFKTVILPYLLLSIPALIIFTVLTKRVGMWPWFYTLPIWEQIGLFILTGKHLAPLWFVPTITLFYFAAPILLAIDKRFPILYWLVLPLLVLSTYIGRDGHLGPIDKAIYLLPIYVLGMAFSHYQNRAEALVARYWIPLLGLTLVGLGGYVFQWPMPPYYLMVMKAPMSLLITVALLRWHAVFGRRLDYIGHVSFGIFFIHAYFISGLKVATVYILTGGHVYQGEGGSDLAGGPIVFLCYATLVLAISVMVIWIAQKVFGKRSRMIVGA